ncbi:hypothetical protein GCM10027203_06860 [Nonomuraea fastidiosa]
MGTVEPRPGDRVAIASEGALDALGAERLEVLLMAGASPAACLDRVFDGADRSGAQTRWPLRSPRATPR